MGMKVHLCVWCPARARRLLGRAAWQRALRSGNAHRFPHLVKLVERAPLDEAGMKLIDGTVPRRQAGEAPPRPPQRVKAARSRGRGRRAYNRGGRKRPGLEKGGPPEAWGGDSCDVDTSTSFVTFTDELT